MGREEKEEKEGVGNGKRIWKGKKGDKESGRSYPSLHGSFLHPRSATGDVLIF